MPMFTRRPTLTEAHRWTRNGDHPLDYVKELVDHADPAVRWSAEHQREHNWEGQLVRYFRHPEYTGSKTHDACGHIWHDHGWIDTGRYGHTVCPGDWIIPDAAGEYYPCRPDVFDATYVRLPEPDPLDSHHCITDECDACGNGLPWPEGVRPGEQYDDYRRANLRRWLDGGH